MSATVNKLILVSDLILDLDNPRMYHHGISGSELLTDQQIEQDILANDNDIQELIRSIQAEGVKEAIYVIPVENGKYRVLEGNRRTVVSRQLVRENYSNENRPDLDFSKIPAQVIDKETPEKEIFKSKVIWQTGKSAWGAYNVAAATYRLRHQFLMSPDDIAHVTQTSTREVRLALKAYDTYKDYANETGDVHTSRFSFFSKECPQAVTRWVAESPENKENYFKWINPNDEGHRIRSVATRGGLRDFKFVIDNENALREFISDPTMTVGDALDIVREIDVTKGNPWLKQIEKVSQGLNSLDEDSIEKVKDENYKPKLVALKRAIENILEEMSR